MFRKTPVVRALAIAFCGTASMMAGQGALAQATSTILERVEITGSSLRRVDAETALPVTVITAQELQRQGITNAEQALQRIASNQSNFGISSGVGATTGGKSEADLRGLSGPTGTNSNKTLVLLNGRRLPNHAFDAAAADLNAIPLSAISRIEVLRDGASAIYGTDAIGGVINFILRKDYVGLEASVETLQPRGAGGGDTNRASITAGFGSLTENRFNIMGTLDVRKQKVLEAKDRPFAATGILGSTRAALTSGTSGTSFPGDLNGFEPSGPTCRPPNSLPRFTTPDNTGAFNSCRYDFTRQIDIIPENKQTTGLVRGSFAITPDHTATVEILHAKNEGIQKVAAAPNNYTMLASSPFFPAGAPLSQVRSDPNNPNSPLVNRDMDPNTPGVQPGGAVNFRLVPGGKRTSGTDTTNQRAMLELQGALAGWEYRTAFGQAKNKSQASVVRGYLFDNVIQQGLFNGIINPFGPDVAATPAEQAVYGAATANGPTLVGTNDAKFADLRVTKDLMQLPAGPLSAAFGVEYRREKSFFVATDITAELGSLGIDPDSDTSGSRKSTSVYAELGIPIVKTFDVTLAARYDKYSDFGNTFNPKVGLRWQPIQQVVMRGSYNTGFRAPTLYEIYQPPSLTFTTDNYNDPLLCPGGTAVPGASAGVVCGQQVLQRQAGPGGVGQPISNLSPEKSKTFTVGVVFEPVRSLTVGIDVWRIRIKDLISVFPEQAIFGDPVANASRFFRCSQLPAGPGPGIDRTDADVCVNYPSFDPIAFIDGPNANLGELRTSGVDLSLAWRSGALPVGNVNVTLDGTYVTKYEYQRERGGAFFNALGRYSDNAPVFRWQHALTVNWTTGPWGATLAQRFKSGYLDQDETSRVGSYDIYDASVTYTGIKNLTLTAGIKNLLDTDPPRSVQTTAFQRGFDPRFTDPVGRAFMLRAAYKFL